MTTESRRRPTPDHELPALAEAAAAIRAAGRGFFLGVSLMSNRKFSKSYVRSCASSLAPVPFVLLIADSLEAINHRLLRGMSDADASEKALAVGANYLRGFLKIRATNPSFYPLLASKVEDERGYSEIRDSVIDQFAASRIFRAEIRREVRHNLGQRSRLLIGNGHQMLLEEYVLREVALTLFLHSTLGPNLVQLSPKRLSLLGRLSRFDELLARVGLSRAEVEYRWLGEEGERAAA